MFKFDDESGYFIYDLDEEGKYNDSDLYKDHIKKFGQPYLLSLVKWVGYHIDRINSAYRNHILDLSEILELLKSAIEKLDNIDVLQNDDFIEIKNKIRDNGDERIVKEDFNRDDEFRNREESFNIIDRRPIASVESLYMVCRFDSDRKGYDAFIKKQKINFVKESKIDDKSKLKLFRLLISDLLDKAITLIEASDQYREAQEKDEYLFDFLKEQAQQEDESQIEEIKRGEKRSRESDDEEQIPVAKRIKTIQTGSPSSFPSPDDANSLQGSSQKIVG